MADLDRYQMAFRILFYFNAVHPSVARHSHVRYSPPVCQMKLFYILLVISALLNFHFCLTEVLKRQSNMFLSV